MKKIDLDDLERKAQAATPGNWTAITPPNDVDGCSTGAVVAAVAPRQRVYKDHRGGIAVEANRQHIAAASPPVVLALIERIRELEDGIRDLLASARPHPVEHPTMTAAWSDAGALLEKGAVLP